MTTVTAQNLLDQYLGDRGITLSAVQYTISLGRLQKVFTDAGGTTPTNLAISLALLKNQDIKADAETNTPVGGSSAQFVAGNVELAITEIEESPVGPGVITFTLTADATEINEAAANTFTVTASAPVTVATEVTFQLALGTAQLNDFGAGSFNPAKVVIPAGETTATYAYTAIGNDGTELSETYSVTATVAGVAVGTQNVTILDGNAGAGETFMLTKGLDNVPGTAGNDTIIGSVDDTNTELNTLSTLDVVNGGAGVDTLRVSFNDAATPAIVLPNLSSVEIIEVQATQNFTLNTSTTAGVTDLNVTKSTGTAGLTASDAQNISVAGATKAVTIDGGKNVTVSDATAGNDIVIGAATGPAGTVTVTDSKQGLGDILVDGGTDVSITATSSTATGIIEVGAESASATGTVTIVQNLNDDGSGLVADDIAVLGGTTVNITVNATSKATEAGQDGDIFTGEIDVLGDGKTTEVNVTQTATVTSFTTPAVAAVPDQTVVTFAALAASQTASVNGLTFTASKALTAEQVAAAFANLTAGDTQSATGPTANGFYTGANSTAAFVSGAVSGKTVTFTAAYTVGDVLTLAGSIPAVAPTKTSFTAGSASSGGVPTTNDVVFQDVDIDDAADAAITTITLDGFAGAYLGGGSASGTGAAINAAIGESLDKLTSLSVANGNDVYLDTTSTTLALKVNNINGSVDLDDGVASVATLTLTTEGVASDIELIADAVKTLTINAGADLDLTANGPSTLTALVDVDINGAGEVILGDISGAAGLKTVNAADNTGGVTAKMLGTVATYVGSAGVDNLTIANAGTAISKALDLGAGHDYLTLVGATVAVPGVTINGGDDFDTLSIDTASAAALDGDTLFAAKLSSFEHLFINNPGAGGEDINLANLGFAQSVSVAGSLGTVTLSNVANNGAVYVVGNAATGVTVNVKDAAAGVADVLNVGLLAGAGNLTVAEVETIALSVTAAASANLIADKATTVTLSGWGDLALDLDAGATLAGNTVTLVDGSAGYSGALTMDALFANLVVKGGSGADNLLANANDVALYGGDGADTLAVAGGLRVNLHGGAGADKFVISVGASNALDSYTVINGVDSGDVIQFGDAVKFISTKIALSVGADETLLNYANQAAKQLGENEMGWFQRGGNTYIVLDQTAGAANFGGAADSFDNGVDQIIMITGLVDLGTGASFNDSNILEIV